MIRVNSYVEWKRSQIPETAAPHRKTQCLSRNKRIQKRCLDVLVSLVCLVLSSPIILFAAIAIKVEDRGRVFFWSPRVGENGACFLMLKLRTMVEQEGAQCSETHTNGEEGYKHRNDRRVTTVGRFLRRASIDEFPQFWNVLIGDMSLVGPRPELVEIVNLYEPWQYARLTVPQGITGWWQVTGRGNNAMHHHTDKDFYYIENMSLWFDLTILVRTVIVVISGRRAF